MAWNSTFRTTEKYEITWKLSIFLQFFKSNNLKSSYWKIIAQTNKQVLCFGKIHFICYMNNRVTILTVAELSNTSRATRKKHSRVHRAKTSKVTPSFYCSFWMSYIRLTLVSSLKQNLGSTSFSRELPEKAALTAAQKGQSTTTSSLSLRRCAATLLT